LKNYIFLIVSAGLLLLARCAKIGYPEGGLKDETLPVVVKAVPENFSLHFNRKRIEIEFDEFIQLKNINQELVVSPPLEEKPVVRLRNKTLVIDLNSELHPNTTYTFNFGQAISDYNEGNMLENFEFVFSTGDYIDSLAIAGSLYSAFNLKMNEEPVQVLVYENLNDSAPYKEIPTYVGKSNKKGIFRVNNLKADTFRVFALKDANSNFLYDNPEEEIAFLDSFIILDPRQFQRLKDTCVPGDSNSQIPDTSLLSAVPADTSLLEPDSTRILTENPYTVLVNLFLFLEDNKPQYLVDKSRIMANKIRLIFNRPLRNEVLFNPMNFSSDNQWFIRENHLRNDTVDFWMTDSLIYKKDTLLMGINYEVTDSMMNLISRTDTFKFVTVIHPEKEKRGKKEVITKEKSGVQVELSIKSRETQNIYQGISLTPFTPVRSMDPQKLHLSYMIDTLSYKQDFTIEKDTFYLRMYIMKTTWQEDMPYTLFIEPGAFNDIYGHTNDTIRIPFRTQTSEHYGRIITRFTNVNMPLIIQLFTTKEVLVREQYLEQDGSIIFSYLEPDSYLLKIIYDQNGNRKWDTGKYLENRQPEKVSYYSGPVEVRANWDKEVLWELGK